MFAPAYGSPFVRDLDDGRRYGTIEDFRNFVKLASRLAVAAPLGRDGLRAGRPSGQQAPPRHGSRPYRLSRQAVHGLGDPPGPGPGHGEMARIVFGADTRAHAAILSLINANSPLVWDGTMLGAARATPRRTRPCSSPRSSWRGDEPATVAGAATQTLAESLAGMAYVQLVRPGAPVVLGSSPRRCRCSPGRPRSALPSRPWSSTPWPRWPAVSACRSEAVARSARRRSPTPRPRTSRRTPCSQRCSPA